MRVPGWVHRWSLRVETAWDGLRARTRGAPSELTVVPYLGHGTPAHVIARGRVLSGGPVTEAVAQEPLWRRMRRMASRFGTREVPDVRLRLHLGGASAEASTDEEGYYRVELHDLDVAGSVALHDVRVEVLGAHAELPAHIGLAQALVPTADARCFVVSDIDDTVLQSGATQTLRLIWTTVTNSAYTRRWFPGVDELYRGLSEGAGGDADNPFCYVSSSPWNLYGFLVAFLRRSRLPVGPLHLRDLGIDERRFVKGSHDDHKREAIDELADLHDLDLVLIGDTGQRDPWIYRQAVADHPGRVRVVLLRHVAGDDRLSEVRELFADSPVAMGTGPDSSDLADTAESVGLVPAGWAARVRDAAVRAGAGKDKALSAVTSSE